MPLTRGQAPTKVSATCRDLSAAPGTWQKWVDGEGFCEPGLGGRDVSLSPLNQAPGGNPAVHWNVLLQARASVCRDLGPA